MGKHERKWVENIEKYVSESLDGNSISPSELEREEKQLIQRLKSRISSDWDITHAYHVGNNYSSIGDILLLLSNNKYKFIEIKLSKSNKTSGRGTLANVSQDMFAKYNLFDGCKPWSEFRNNYGHFDYLRNKTSEFPWEDEDLKEPDGTKTQIYNRAKELKNIIGATQNTEKEAEKIISKSTSSPKENKAASIILDIIKFDLEKRKKYLKHLDECDQNSENIKRFSLLLLSGFHTEEKLNKYWNIDMNNLINYGVYYAEIGENGVRITYEDRDNISKLSDSAFYIKLNPDENVSLSICAENNPILSCSLHWKNKFQGVQTPCVNIFDSRAHKQIDPE